MPRHGSLFGYDLRNATPERELQYGACVIKGDLLHRFSATPSMVRRPCEGIATPDLPLYSVSSDVHAIVAVDSPLWLAACQPGPVLAPELVEIPPGHVFVSSPGCLFSDPFAMHGTAQAFEISAPKLLSGGLPRSLLHAPSLANGPMRSAVLQREFAEHVEQACRARPQLAASYRIPDGDRRIIEIPLVRATAQNLRDYATLSFDAGDQSFECDGEVVLHTYKYGPRPGWQHETEYHIGFTQTFMPLDGEIVIVMGRPTYLTDPSRRMPDQLTGFIIPRGSCVQLESGTWHDFPMAYQGYVCVLTTIKQTMYGANYDNWGEGGMFKRYLDRISGVAWVLELA